MPMKTLTAFLDIFKSVPLFEGMTVEQIQTIINVMKLKQVDAGQRITEEGANEDSVFILMDGEVEISKRLTLALWGNDSEQQAKSLIRLTGDDHAFFGEMALFQEIPERSASIASLKPCKLAVLEKKDLLHICDKDPRIGSIIFRNIARELTLRLVKANKDILKLTTAFSLALEGD